MELHSKLSGRALSRPPTRCLSRLAVRCSAAPSQMRQPGPTTAKN